jgi:predicted RNA-binding protein with PUA-like domain
VNNYISNDWIALYQRIGTPSLCSVVSNSHIQSAPFRERKSNARLTTFTMNKKERSNLRYWLMKSEPGDVSIDDLASFPDQTVAWYGVRNYQARNFMRDQMTVGEGVLFYHSNCKVPGIAGIAKVSSVAYPDATQFDKKNKYFDEKATQETPRWFNVDVQLVRKIALISLDEMRQHEALENMRTLQRGNRLSITPVDPAEWKFIINHLCATKVE